MAKKKHAKPSSAARGYATVSNPKKITPEENPDNISGQKTIVKHQAAVKSPSSGSSKQQSQTKDDVSLLEKLSASQNLTFLTQQAKSNSKQKLSDLPQIHVDQEVEAMVQSVLSFGNESPMHSDESSSLFQKRINGNITIDKCNKIYLALQEIGFQEDDIEKAMTALPGMEFISLLNWLSFYTPIERLPTGFFDKFYQEKLSLSFHPADSKEAVDSSSDFSNEKDIIRDPSPKKKNKSSDKLSESHSPDSMSYERHPDNSLHISSENNNNRDTSHCKNIKRKDQDLKKWILSRYYNEEEEVQQQDIIQEYIECYIKMEELKSLAKSQKLSDPKAWRYSNEQIDKYIKLLGQLRLSPQFKESEAIEGIQERTNKPKQIPSSKKKSKNKTEPLETDETDLLNLFEEALPSEEPSEPTQDPGIHPYRSFLNPSSWTGKTPIQILQEWYRKMHHQNVKISFFPVSTRRGFRAGLNITDTSRKTDPLLYTCRVEEEACYTEREAQHYAATLALYRLSDSPLYLTLPPPFKELWIEWKTKKEEEKRTGHLKRHERRVRFLQSVCSDLEKDQSISILQQAYSKKQPQAHFSHDKNLNYFKMFQIKKEQELYHHFLNMRRNLPIFSYKEDIISCVLKNQVVIVEGETGSGKSTQVPQFVLEHFLENKEKGMIICTQPRRISAVSIAKRVSEEMGDGPNALGKPGKSFVGYQVRLESKMTKSTRLLFCTTGILLRYLETDINVSGISCIIIDEVHERSLDSDFLMTILQKILHQRRDLKVILMSATMETGRFSSYFNDCPILSIPGRTFPVQVNFLEDIVEYTGYVPDRESVYTKKRSFRNQNVQVKMKGKGGKKYTTTAQWEEEFFSESGSESEREDEDTKETSKQYSDHIKSVVKALDPEKINYELMVTLIEQICHDSRKHEEKAGAILVFLPGYMEIRRMFDSLMSAPFVANHVQSFSIFPLHSVLSGAEQQRVFEKQKEGVWKVVLATNIAETGITIPDITCVIDTGRVKEIRYDIKTGMSTLEECFISKANAGQRRGRAGRVQSGVCFHLFGKKIFKKMKDRPTPEIKRLRLEELCLKIAVYGYRIPDILSMALDPPTEEAIEDATKVLQSIEALDGQMKLTSLGFHLSNLPVDARLGKMILYSVIFGCLDPILTVASLLTLNSKSIYTRKFGEQEKKPFSELGLQEDQHHYSDLLCMVSTYNVWRNEVQKQNGKYNGMKQLNQFCQQRNLDHEVLCSVEDIKIQLLTLVVSTIDFVNISDEEGIALGRLRYDTLKMRIPLCPVLESLNKNNREWELIKSILTCGLYPHVLQLNESKQAWAEPNQEEPLHFPHPSTSIYHGVPFPAIDKERFYYIYHTKLKTSRIFVRDLTQVPNLAILLFGGEIGIKHFSKRIEVHWDEGKHLEFRCVAKTAVIISRIREELDLFLKNHFNCPLEPISERERQLVQGVIDLISSCPRKETSLKEQGE